MDRTQTSASRLITAQHAAAVKSSPMHDEADLVDARRGFLGALNPGAVRGPDGRVVWDNDSYGFLSGELRPR